MFGVSSEQIAWHTDRNLVVGDDGGAEMSGKRGRRRAEEEQEVPSLGREGWDVEDGGFDDEITRLRGDDDFDGWSLLELLDEDGKRFSGGEAEEMER